MRQTKINFAYLRRSTLFLLCAAMLCSCTPASQPYVQQRAKLPCKVCGASDAEIMQMQAYLNNKGIKVISIGQDYLISIPSKFLFASESPRIVWAGFGALNEVSCYLKQFRKVAITVTSFSDKCLSPRREQALTLTRARAVGEYLKSQGIDSRFIFTEGLGSDKPIVNYQGGEDASPNSRVEITFRRQVA